MSGPATGGPLTRIAGTGVRISGRDIDTDRIMPARFLRAITFAGLEAHVFEDDRAAEARAGRVHPIDDETRRGAQILIAGANFGCGSSREHAPQALRRWGIRAIVGASFADIFRGNACALGMPCVTLSAADLGRLAEDVDAHADRIITIDLESRSLTAASLAVPIGVPDELRDALRTGAWDVTGLLLDRYGEVERVAAALPYLHG